MLRHVLMMHHPYGDGLLRALQFIFMGLLQDFSSYLMARLEGSEKSGDRTLFFYVFEITSHFIVCFLRALKFCVAPYQECSQVSIASYQK